MSQLVESPITRTLIGTGGPGARQPRDINLEEVREAVPQKKLKEATAEQKKALVHEHE